MFCLFCTLCTFVIFVLFVFVLGNNCIAAFVIYLGNGYVWLYSADSSYNLRVTCLKTVVLCACDL